MRYKTDKGTTKKHVDTLKNYLRYHRGGARTITVKEVKDVLSLPQTDAGNFLHRSAFFEATTERGVYALSNIPGMSNSVMGNEQPRMAATTLEDGDIQENPREVLDVIMEKKARETLVEKATEKRAIEFNHEAKGELDGMGAPEEKDGMDEKCKACKLNKTAKKDPLAVISRTAYFCPHCDREITIKGCD